jgi:hypothetical protein
VNESRAYDPSLHEEGSTAAAGGCSYHETEGRDGAACTREAVISFQDDAGGWQSGCSAALQQLVRAEQIEPFGQGA